MTHKPVLLQRVRVHRRRPPVRVPEARAVSDLPLAAVAVPAGPAGGGGVGGVVAGLVDEVAPPLVPSYRGVGRPAAFEVPQSSRLPDEVLAGGRPVRRSLGLVFTLLLVFLLVLGTVGLGALTLIRSDYRQLSNTVFPAQRANRVVLLALVNAETGVRGFRLTRDRQFLQPYQAGVTALPGGVDTIRRTVGGDATVRRRLAAEQEAATAWLQNYARPVIAGVAVPETVGKRLFDSFRTANRSLDVAIDGLRSRGAGDLNGRILIAIMVIGGCLAVGLAVGIHTAVGTSRRLVRPLATVTDAVVNLARGRLATRLVPDGPSETRAVAASVNLLADELDRAEAERSRAAAEIAAAQRRLEAANRGLADANSELEAFSYNISHDLRAPLRAMDGFSKLVLTDYADQIPAPGQNALQRIRASSQRMTALIDALLAFARLGRQELTRQQVQPTDIARRALGDLDDDIAGRAVQVTVAADLPACAADPALLAVVYTNLLSNALKYSRGRDPAVIDVGWQQQDDQVVYHVADNGAGFDQRYADKLFGVFQRLHRAQEFEGIGIGLALVQRVIQRHGGQIWAAGQVEHGATFFFTLPGGTPS